MLVSVNLPMQRMANLVEAVHLGDPEVARGLVEGVLLEEEPDLVARVKEVIVLCLQKCSFSPS